MRTLAKKSKISTFIIIIIVLLSLLSIALIYQTNPTVIDNIPIGTVKQPEPTATTSPEPTATPQIQSSATNNNTIKVAAFNLQIFGTSKASKPEVVAILSKIIRNYDVIAVQEIRDSSQTALPMLRDAVNSMGSSKYEYVVSERLGRTTSKEQYAYLFNTQTMQVIGSPYVYLDSNDIFQREPYVAEFKAKKGNFDFVLITIHTDPDTATQEINYLPKIVEDAKIKYLNEGDLVIMGDLNADCDYFKENSQSPLRSSDYYYWIINNSVDTTTKSTDCSYDRIIITTPAITDYTGSSGVFRFDKAYNLTYDGTIAVSDHYPVYATFWGNRDTD
jgi:endonuclease/exonuclease/phosphatase family metal-dependent hydrolase